MRAAGVVLSEGQRRFAALETKRTALASVLGVSKQMVSLLASGRARPGLDLAYKIERKIGILMTAWCRLPSKVALDQRRLRDDQALATIGASKPRTTDAA
jgi:plasmid maintenance system antidote protein VapI